MKKKKYSVIKHRNLKGYAFSTQMIIAAGITIIFPLIVSILLSFTNIKLNINNFEFVGFKNYLWVFNEEASGFFKAVGISVGFSLITTLVQTVLGFLLAVMLYFLSGKLQGIYKTIIYLPVVLPSAVVSAMWLMLYSGDEYGILNVLFGLTNPPFQWLNDNTIGFICLIITNTWRFVGTTTIIYLVSMTNVSKEVIESAEMDGCSKFKLMTKIILPLTWGATTMNIILSMIGGIKSFDLFYLFQTNGNLSTDLTPVSLLIYRLGLGNKDITNISLSKSVTMSIVLAIIMAILTLVVNKIFKGKDDGSEKI